jgi:NAD(P)-dependent dehydrogenase (short-subunit alcohol dehydrogenase family)
MNLKDLSDELLELLVVPSFTRTGYAIRRRLFAWEDPSAWSLAGRTVVLTGPTSGLGREAAESMARMDARLVLVGRDPTRLDAVRDELVATTGNAAIVTAVADLSSLASVRSAADGILASEPRIDVIVDNAGAMFPDRQLTAEGHERTLATMVLGPFVLESRLLPRLLESPDPRIVAVTSGGMYTQSLPLDDLGSERGTYTGALAYARAKRAQVALIREWARRLRGRGLRGRSVSVNAMHPGWADTPGLAASLPGFRERLGGQLRTAAEGVDTLLWLAAAPDGADATGRLFLDRRPRPFDRVPATRLDGDARRMLWNAVVELSGESDPAPGA